MNSISCNFGTDLSQLSLASSYSSSSSSNTEYDIYYPMVSTEDQNWNSTVGFNCQKVYLSSSSVDSIVYIIQGANLQYIVSNISNSNGSSDQVFPSLVGQSTGNSTQYYSTYWQDPAHIPYVKVLFSK